MPPSLKLSAMFVACLICVPACFADTIHQFGKRDGYWHHGSGWIFARQVGAFALAGSPAEMDGSGDVTSTYVMASNGSNRTAYVEIFYPDSTAAGAKLISAKAAVQAGLGEGQCVTSRTEKTFALKAQPALVGTRVMFAPATGGACAQASLYFFQTARWVIAVRATASAEDAGAATALDELVRALPWETLDTDPMAHDPSP